MLRYFLIFLVTISAIITGQSNGTQELGKTKIIKSAYQSQEEETNYVNLINERERINHYDSREYNEDREGTSSSEDVKGDLQTERDSRRMFEWISRFFKTTTASNIQTTTTTESSYTKELKERIFLKALHRNLTEMLFKLSEVEKRVAVAMNQKEAYSILIKGKPEIVGLNNGYYYRGKFKRDVADETKGEAKNHITDKSVNNTKNSTNHISTLNATECPCEHNITNGRRSGSVLTTPTEVKNKLLLYLQDSFQEIQEKVQSLKNLKQSFSDNVSFKIGYILANIDTLEVNLYNLKNNMDKNKQFWEDNKILELYDTLKVSNQAVSGLIESLKVYLEKLHQGQANNGMNFG